MLDGRMFFYDHTDNESHVLIERV
jgi:aspartyl-tRNA(Asn)/glutamyl-tRNA(Gln) amidotransferase subunit B